MAENVQSTTLTAKKTNLGNNVPTNASTGSETVTVASKLPWGLHMQIYDFRTEYEAVMGGGSREFKMARPRHGAKTYTIKGNSYNKTMGDNGKQIEAGYAVTHGIPKAFWEEWLSQNREADYIVNGMIFAHQEYASVAAEAKEKEAIKSGLERLDPRNLPKIGNRKIETGKID